LTCRHSCKKKLQCTKTVVVCAVRSLTHRCHIAAGVQFQSAIEFDDVVVTVCFNLPRFFKDSLKWTVLCVSIEVFFFLWCRFAQGHDVVGTSIVVAKVTWKLSPTVSKAWCPTSFSVFFLLNYLFFSLLFSYFGEVNKHWTQTWKLFTFYLTPKHYCVATVWYLTCRWIAKPMNRCMRIILLFCGCRYTIVSSTDN